MFTSISLLNKMIIKDKSTAQAKFTLPNEGSRQHSGAWSVAICQLWSNRLLSAGAHVVAGYPFAQVLVLEKANSSRTPVAAFFRVVG